MGFSIVLAVTSRKRTKRPDLRTITTAVRYLQIAEGDSLHAIRDRCLIHALRAGAIRRHYIPMIPRRLLKDSEWVHRHIEAPGVRIQARIEDERRTDA